MEDKKLKVYISGPISHYTNEGRLEECVDIFQKAENRLSDYGYVVLNPLKNGVESNAPWVQHMIEDIKMLDKADIICFLHTCELYYSPGVEIEKTIARRSNKIEIREVNNADGIQYHRTQY